MPSIEERCRMQYRSFGSWLVASISKPCARRMAQCQEKKPQSDVFVCYGHDFTFTESHRTSDHPNEGLIEIS